MSYDISYRKIAGDVWLSQSLWNRAVSYDGEPLEGEEAQKEVSIPLEQGSVLRHFAHLMSEEKFDSLNPFGTGQCLTTAVGSSSLVRQGLPKPLPNFFRDSESWVLVWLNVEQVLTFHLHIKRSKTSSILPEF